VTPEARIRRVLRDGLGRGAPFAMAWPLALGALSEEERRAFERPEFEAIFRRLYEHGQRTRDESEQRARRTGRDGRTRVLG